MSILAVFFIKAISDKLSSDRLAEIVLVSFQRDESGKYVKTNHHSHNFRVIMIVVLLLGYGLCGVALLYVLKMWGILM